MIARRVTWLMRGFLREGLHRAAGYKLHPKEEHERDEQEDADALEQAAKNVADHR